VNSLVEMQQEIIAGLKLPQAMLAPKYFYDELGSQLFNAITLLDEYYPPKAEAEILSNYASDMAKWLGAFDVLVDVGAADGRKAQSIFEALSVKHYWAVDISGQYLNRAVAQLQREHPAIEMQAIVQDFSQALLVPGKQRKVFFYPGSSLGNFTPSQALVWLRHLRANEPCTGLILGLDLVKPKPILDAAYDDALGVTASFNLNCLRHINRLLQSDFNPAQWRHQGFFNESLSRVEMHVETREALMVSWPGGERKFAQGETIHTESSYKYTPDSAAKLLNDAGFGQTQFYFDAQKRFTVVCAKP
jgi:dimethylhistidine N-methyltransferase